jgi:hypothetical protein
MKMPGLTGIDDMLNSSPEPEGLNLILPLRMTFLIFCLEMIPLYELGLLKCDV